MNIFVCKTIKFPPIHNKKIIKNTKINTPNHDCKIFGKLKVFNNVEFFAFKQTEI